MANFLDEQNGPVNVSGRDVNVIDKQKPVTIGWGSTFFEIILWFPLGLLLLIPPLVYLFKKIKARTYLEQLEQKINSFASTIQNQMEQRRIILKEAASLVANAANLEKETFIGLAEARSGNTTNQNHKSQENKTDDAVVQKLHETAWTGDRYLTGINVVFERYPELKSQNLIARALDQSNKLQREITAARDLCNDVIKRWNTEIFVWPTKRIVAARSGYTTRVPFSISSADKAEARSNFFA